MTEEELGRTRATSNRPEAIVLRKKLEEQRMADQAKKDARKQKHLTESSEINQTIELLSAQLAEMARRTDREEAARIEERARLERREDRQEAEREQRRIDEQERIERRETTEREREWSRGR